MLITPSDASIGAYVTEVDLATVDASTFRTLESAFVERGVLVFPRANLDQTQHIAFSRRFGLLERTLSQRADQPEISLLSNVKKDGSLAAKDDTLELFLRGNQTWHSDSSFKVVGAKASILRAIETPPSGGDTEWADMCAGWDSLDDKDKSALHSLSAIHSYAYSQGLLGGLGLLTEAEQARLPPVEHPVVMKHPDLGRNALYVGRHIRNIVGWNQTDTHELLSRVLDKACQPPRLFRHSWSDGDIAIWDNRRLVHRGYPWPRGQRRVMERTTVAGTGTNPWAIAQT